MGGELTGRLIHLSNHLVFDTPITNYSQDYTTKLELITSEFMFDEVRPHSALNGTTPKEYANITAKALMQGALIPG